MFTRSNARRNAVSMPSASTSTFSSPRSLRSSLSHCTTVRSTMVAFSMGTSSSSGAFRDDEAADMLGQMPRKAGKVHELARQRTKPGSTGLSGSNPASRKRSGMASPPSHHCMTCEVAAFLAQAKHLAQVAQGAARPVHDDGGGDGGALAAVFS